jgi:hypothetical protein
VLRLYLAFKFDALNAMVGMEAGVDTRGHTRMDQGAESSWRAMVVTSTDSGAVHAAAGIILILRSVRSFMICASRDARIFCATARKSCLSEACCLYCCASMHAAVIVSTVCEHPWDV